MATGTIDVVAEFGAYRKQPPRSACSVGTAIGSLSRRDKRVLADGCERPQEGDGAVDNASIARWLAARGHDVKWQAVRNHRLGQCSCDH